MPMKGHFKPEVNFDAQSHLVVFKACDHPTVGLLQNIYSVAVSYLESREQVHPQGDSLAVSKNSILVLSSSCPQ